MASVRPIRARNSPSSAEPSSNASEVEQPLDLTGVKGTSCTEDRLAERGIRWSRPAARTANKPGDQRRDKENDQIEHLRGQLITGPVQPRQDKILEQIAGLSCKGPGFDPAEAGPGRTQRQERQQPEDIPGLKPLGRDRQIPGQ